MRSMITEITKQIPEIKNINRRNLILNRWNQMKRGQSALEYMVLVIIVAGALLTMQVYIKRGLSGSWRVSIDAVGEQYEPKKTVSDTTYTLTSNTISNIVLEGNLQACESGGCYTNRLDYTNTQETRIGTENIAGY